MPYTRYTFTKTNKASASYLTCSEDSVGYRFGFNGQEKDNEITGVEGSHNTAEYWMYDTRLGRRWNVDPVDQVYISNYACFGNNPIFNLDIKGNKSEGWIKGSDGKVSYDKDINSQSEFDAAQNNGEYSDDFEYAGQTAYGVINGVFSYGDSWGNVSEYQMNTVEIVGHLSKDERYKRMISTSWRTGDYGGMWRKFVKWKTGLDPDGDNSGELGIAGSIEVSTAIALGSGASYSAGIFWTANNQVTTYVTNQDITHGVTFSIGVQTFLYHDTKGNGVTADDFTGKGWQSSMGLGPFGYSESYNYNSNTGKYGDEYKGRGVSIGFGLEGLPATYTNGPTNTIPLR